MTQCQTCGRFARAKESMTARLRLEVAWRKVFAKCKPRTTGENDGTENI